MKKFIKINLIILVIFCLTCNWGLIKNYATENLEQEIEKNEENSDSEEEKDLDALQLEKSELENGLEESNAQIQFIESELTSTVMEISEINQKIYDKQIEIETLEAQEKDLLAYIEKAEEELEKSNERYDEQKELLEK